jgi:hypothetical protein
VRFHAFDFAPDRKTFTMGSTFVTKTESPKQTAHIQLSGREVRRTCADRPTAGARAPTLRARANVAAPAALEDEDAPSANALSTARMVMR